MENENNLPATTQQLITDLSELIIPMPLAVDPAGAAVVLEFRKRCQQFTGAINRMPGGDSITKTPDNKALSVLISHIEMTLDEMFFGLWDTVDFRWQVVANEIVGSILLVVTHPVTGKEIKRTGAAAIQITVDAMPEEFKELPGDPATTKKEKRTKRNKWAMDLENKKSNALDLSFPKLKAECLKNAAQSLGKVFGRDLNRVHADQHRPLLRDEKKESEQATKSQEVINQTKESILKANQRVQPR